MDYLLVLPGAIAIGLSLGLLGSGGSILTVPVLVYLLGQDEKVAIAGSLFIVGTIALAGGMQFLRAGFIQWRSVIVFGLPGMAGTYLGAVIAAYIPGVMQLALFALVMLGAVSADLRKPREAREMWERVLLIDPTHVAARENLATLENSKLDEFVDQTQP